ncbi:MAG: G8 domain-containing protein, partial [Bacteroidota bacterium]|nr:G8 domain-containing protein [Bacteroidota bacterium]
MRLLLSFILLLCLALSFSCNKNKHCKTLPAADFLIEEIIWDDTPGVVTDTIVEFGTISLRALREYDSYEWQIGTEQQPRTGKSPRVSFGPLPEPITITFTGRREPMPECFPDDDGIDVISKQLAVVPQKKAPIFGKYQGYDPESLG